MRKKLLFLVLAIFLLSGCNQDEDGTTAFEEMNENGNVDLQPINNQPVPDGFYERDLETRDSNNAGTNYVDLSENRTDLGDDQGKLRDIIERSNAFEPGMIYVVGRSIRVNVRAKDNFSENELQQLTNELEKDLIRAMPRYDIRLNVKEAK